MTATMNILSRAPRSKATTVVIHWCQPSRPSSTSTVQSLAARASAVRTHPSTATIHILSRSAAPAPFIERRKHVGLPGRRGTIKPDFFTSFLAATPLRRQSFSSSPSSPPSSSSTTDQNAVPPAVPADGKEPGAPSETDKASTYRACPPLTLPQLLGVYSELSKARLASFVTLTTMVGYALAPTATAVTTLLATTIGTHLCVTSANTFNQLMESPYDAQMSRTRNRPLVRHAITPFHAAAFAVGTGVAGIASLAAFVNPLTAALGGANLVLYAFIYTPMKRLSIANTWVGAIVGAIPPMMGWTACTNSLALPDDLGAYVLGFLMYAWQFPHFNSLSWNIRADYSKAGYRMAAVTDPALNARVSLRYALAMLPVPVLTSYMGLTTWWFVATSSVANGAMALYAYRFWRQRNDKSARDLFFSSLFHLPIVFGAMLVHRAPRDGEDQVSLLDRIKYWVTGKWPETVKIPDALAKKSVAAVASS
ncbi:Protoheme IX farnesyltransferase, mitochondrial [Allomyces javanicus]|nr:Protoheme IX farnesyltransferase, mitochondrial [Allomyces javanicus]